MRRSIQRCISMHMLDRHFAAIHVLQRARAALDAAARLGASIALPAWFRRIHKSFVRGAAGGSAWFDVSAPPRLVSCKRT